MGKVITSGLGDLVAALFYFCPVMSQLISKSAYQPDLEGKPGGCGSEAFYKEEHKKGAGENSGALK